MNNTIILVDTITKHLYLPKNRVIESISCSYYEDSPRGYTFTGSRFYLDTDLSEVRIQLQGELPVVIQLDAIS